MNKLEMLRAIDGFLAKVNGSQLESNKEYLISRFKTKLSRLLKMSAEDFKKYLADTDVTDGAELMQRLADYAFIGGAILVSYEKTIKPQLKKIFLSGWDSGEKALVDALESLPDTVAEIELKFAGMRAASAEGYATARTADLIKGLDTATRDAVRKTIQSSMRKDETWVELQRRLIKHHGFSEYRAELIARTETGIGYNTGAVDAWMSSGVVKAVEVSDGTDSDDACAAANGAVWDFDYAKAHPLEHPNCHREFLPVFSDDLFPKKDKLRWERKVAKDTDSGKILRKERVAATVNKRYGVAQGDVDSLIDTDLNGVRLSGKVEVNNRIRSYGLCKMKFTAKGDEIATVEIVIGRQKNNRKEELADTIVHEELESRIVAKALRGVKKYERLNKASEFVRHEYINKVIKRYFSLKGWDKHG